MSLPVTRALSLQDFKSDAHAARYQGELDAHPAAARRLVELLNEPANEQRLQDVETHGLPALTGVVQSIETDADIEPVLATGTAAHRFRQAVGVAIKLKMKRLGWTTTGRKGTVKGARHFKKAEHYVPARNDDDGIAARALRALDRVRQIGDDDERAATGQVLLDALAETRASEGRVL